MRTLVLACGNTLRGDDGVGWKIAAGVEDELKRDDLEIVFTQQLLPEHAEPVSRAERVVFVDCSAVSAAGTVAATIVQPAEKLPSVFSTHYLDPESMLRLSMEFFGKCPSEAVLLTVGGESFGVGEDLSGPVAAALPAAVDAVKALLV